MSTRQCKICSETKARVQSGNFTNGTKKWVDDSNQLWNGKMCPPCNTKRLADLYTKKKSSAVQPDVGTTEQSN